MIQIYANDHWIIQQAEIHPTQTAVSYVGKLIDYTSFFWECQAAAKYFIENGIEQNNHIALLFSHSYEFWLSVNALWLVGAVPVPLNTRNTHEEINYQYEFCDAKYLITNQTKLDFSNSAIIKQLDFHNSANILSQASLHDEQELSSQQVIAIKSIPSPFFNSKFPKMFGEHSALIMFTSGSSRKPKAVVHTFDSIFASVKSMDSIFNLSHEDIWLASLPFYHIGGFMILVRALICGSSVYIPESVSHDSIKKAISESNPDHLSFVSTMMKRFLDENQKPHCKLKYVFLGGGFLSDSLCTQAINSGWPIVKVYGSTETCSMVTSLLPRELLLKTSSVGKGLGKNQIKIEDNRKIEDANTNEATVVKYREILVSAPSLFKEYYKDKYSTENSLKDGFYQTGDYGHLDNDGYLYIESRREDIIITAGENVVANEVEEAVKFIEEVEDAFVFGIKNNDWGEVVCAAIVSSMHETVITAKLKTKLAAFKIPKQFYYVEEIPRTELGKVNRKELFKILSLD